MPGQFLLQGIILVEIWCASYQRTVQIAGAGFLFAGLLIHLAIARYLAGLRIQAHRTGGRIEGTVVQLVDLRFLGTLAPGIGRFFCPAIARWAQPAILSYLPPWSFLL